ncbi:MAG TPA: SRPBCC family protein [Planctomycetota bacterium]|nr:SRPBCC family protein [Planctomycetota bacterium]
MTELDLSHDPASAVGIDPDPRIGSPADGGNASATAPRRRATNVAAGERAFSVAAGTALAALGLGRRSAAGLAVAAVGGALLHRGTTGHCSAYQALGVDTAHGRRSAEEEVAKRGIRVERSLQIARPAEELYAYWRELSNLPEFMHYLERVEVIDDRRSHWVAKPLTGLGDELSWDAEITADEPGARIAWRSLPGSTIASLGEVRFARALGDRGTDIRVTMEYVPPAGRLGHWVAKMLGTDPRKRMQDDLRRFKQLMELGEIPTNEGQPRGSCMSARG